MLTLKIYEKEEGIEDIPENAEENNGQMVEFPTIVNGTGQPVLLAITNAVPQSPYYNIQGTLKDEGLHPLSQKPIIITIYGEEEEYTDLVVTNDEGKFNSMMEINEICYDLQVRFAGDDEYQTYTINASFNMEGAPTIKESLGNGIPKSRKYIRFMPRVKVEGHAAMLLVNWLHEHFREVDFYADNVYNYWTEISGEYLNDILKKLTQIENTVDLMDKRVKSLAYFPCMYSAPELLRKLGYEDIELFSEEYRTDLTNLENAIKTLKGDIEDDIFNDIVYTYTIEW